MITVVFKDGCDYANAAGLMQWDYGQVLRIQGLRLPAAVEIHFSLQAVGGEAVTRVGTTRDGVTDVVIPDSMLEADKAQNYRIYVWVYLTDATSGETVKSITLSVKARSKPEGFSSPEDADLFREAITAVNESAGRAEEAEASAEAWVHGREDYPDRAEDNAAYYAGQAQESAEAAAGSAGAAAEAESTAQLAADVARQSATKAGEYEAQAQIAATNALQSEQAAKTAQTGAEAAQGAAEVAEDQARQDAEQVAQDKSAVTQKAQEVESARSEVASNKTAVDKTVQEFGVTAEQAVQDVNDAGTVQVQNIQSAGTSQVQAVDNAGAAQMQAVQAEGAEQVTNVQQAAAEIEADREQIEMNRVLAVSSASGIMESAEGAEVILRDSSDRPFQGLKVYGRSEQKTTTGAQLYNVDAVGGRYPMEADKDGYYTLEMDNTAGAADGYKNLTILPSELIEAGTDYLIVAEIAEIENAIFVPASGPSKNATSFIGQFPGATSYPTEVAVVGTQVFSVTSYDDLSVADCMLRAFLKVSPGLKGRCKVRLSVIKDTTVTADTFQYEPYTGGQPSPNPDYPQEIVSAGQVLTTGAQLFDVTTIIDGHYISDFDGSDVGVNGTLCASDYIVVSGMATLYIGQKSNSGAFYDEDKTFLSGIGSSGVPRSIDVPEGAKYLRVTAYIENKDSFMLNEGSAALPWEPYTGGKPGVVDVGIGAEVMGKNLFPDFVTNKTYGNGSTVTINADKSITVHKIAGEPISFFKSLYFPAGNYVLSNGLDSGNPIYIQFDNWSTRSKNKSVIQWSGGEAGLYLYSSAKETGDVTLYPQIELGTEATAYEPYRTPQSLLVTPNGLPGIPVSSGGNYTDADGQQWVCDEIDLERGKYVQRIQKAVLDGSEDEKWIYEENRGNRLGISFSDILNESYKVTDKALCNRLRYNTRVYGDATGLNEIGFIFHNATLFVRFGEDSEINSRNAFISWLQQNNLEVVYKLATPIETDLTPEEIAAYAALHTNYPTTVITNDAGAHMSTTYVADTKAYIDAKFQELQTALANTQAQII